MLPKPLKPRLGQYLKSLYYACFAITTSVFGDGFMSIFDGSTLTGWDGDPKYWRVEEGAIVGETTPETLLNENTFLIWNDDALEDFELKVEFKLANHNSGIQYRSFRLPDSENPWAVGGYQADIAEDPQWMGAAYGEAYKGLIARRGENVLLGAASGESRIASYVGHSGEILAQINQDDWNTYHIIAKGNHCIQIINGVTTATFSESTNDRLHKGLIALQLHSGQPMRVDFRNIRLKKTARSETKQILFLAGGPSHGYATHEHKAGSYLLARSLNESGLDLVAQVATEGQWPDSILGFNQPDAVVMYCDGLEAHVAGKHQERIQNLVDRGVGVTCLHFAVEVSPEKWGDTFLNWLGGYFEAGWSVNPFWTPEFKELPDHPITRGVQPFSIRDEWYYHMRFQPEMEGVTPILSALPPLRTLTSRSKDRQRGSNPTVMEAVQSGESQTVAWAYERPSGGRSFGFTGGHMHQNWQHDDFRKTVLNAIVWTAQMEIPEAGVLSRTPSMHDLALNQDFPKP